MNKITDNCTGCRACEQLCPKRAISILEDDEGFLVAVIDKSQCIECGLCLKRCPQIQNLQKNNVRKSLAVRLRDSDILFHSASGGAFAGIAKAWIEDGGLVYGVAYDADWNACHICVSRIEELHQIQSSKYVQADTRKTFTEIKTLLLKGEKVLFSGTACQVAGLKSFLKRDYDNLLTIGLICHGVNSPLLFKLYVSWLEKKEQSKLNEYNFRSKLAGWALNFAFKTDKCQKMHFCDVDPYYYRFLEGIAYRECCYSCKYCTPNRVEDITIGDYWGIEIEHPDFYSTQGVSCMLINTENGINCWDSYSDRFFIRESSFARISKHNSNLLAPTKRKTARNLIYSGIKSSNTWFEDSFVASFHPSLIARLKDVIPASLKLFIKKFL